MKTVAHTPGPWQINRATTYPDNGGETERVEIIGNNTEICQAITLDAQDTDEQRQQREGNLRLIAAAPELLELCQRSLRILNGEEGIDDDLAEIAFATDLENAIAKSTGGDA